MAKTLRSLYFSHTQSGSRQSSHDYCVCRVNARLDQTFSKLGYWNANFDPFGFGLCRHFEMINTSMFYEMKSGPFLIGRRETFSDFLFLCFLYQHSAVSPLDLENVFRLSNAVGLAASNIGSLSTYEHLCAHRLHGDLLFFVWYAFLHLSIKICVFIGQEQPRNHCTQHCRNKQHQC